MDGIKCALTCLLNNLLVLIETLIFSNIVESLFNLRIEIAMIIALILVVFFNYSLTKIRNQLKNNVLYNSKIEFVNSLFKNNCSFRQDSSNISKIIDEDILNPQYLLLWFKRNEFDRYARYKSHGSAHEYFEFEEMCKVELPVPPIEKQREIVAAYKAITERIELKKKINDNLLASTDAIFSKMFFENKTDSTVSFTDVVQLMGGGTPKTDEDNYWDGNILFFTPKDISNSPFCIATEKHLSENGLKNCSSRLYPSYTTFVTCRGTVGNLSMAGVPMAMNQSCYALKGKKKYPPFFVYSFTRYVIATMKKKASGAVFSALVTRDFEMEKVFEPDIYTALQYHACATPLFDEILSNTKEIQSLTELSQVLLSQLSR